MKFRIVKTTAATIYPHKIWTEKIKSLSICIAEKGLPFCECLLIRWKQRRSLVSWAFWTHNNLRFLLYTVKRTHNVAPWYERQTSFIYSFCWLTFKVWSFPLSFPPQTPPAKKRDILEPTHDLITQLDARGCGWWIGGKFCTVRQTQRKVGHGFRSVPFLWLSACDASACCPPTPHPTHPPSSIHLSVPLTREYEHIHAHIHSSFLSFSFSYYCQYLTCRFHTEVIFCFGLLARGLDVREVLNSLLLIPVPP